MAQRAFLWVFAALLYIKEATAAQQGFLAHYASGNGEESKPPPQPFETNSIPSQLSNLPTDHPLHPDPEIVAAPTETIKTYWPNKIRFHGHHHVRPLKKIHKVKPSKFPPIPPFISDEMTQAIFLDSPPMGSGAPPSNFVYPSVGRKSKGRRKEQPPSPPPLEPTADPSSSSTSTLDPDTTTYLLNSTLVDLTGDNTTGGPQPAFKDAASVPSEGGLLDYLTPPPEGAFSEYSAYSVDITKKPPFKILRLGGRSKKGPKARLRGPSGPNLLFGESQRSQVYKMAPFGHLNPLPGPYKPIPPAQGGFMRYLFPSPDFGPSTPFPIFSPYFGESNELQRPLFKIAGSKKKKQLHSPPPFGHPYAGSNFFNYNTLQPTTSTVIVPADQGWVPIINPNRPFQGLPLTTTPIPFTSFSPAATFAHAFPFTSSSLTPPHSNNQPRPVFLSPQTTKSEPQTTTLPSPSSSSTIYSPNQQQNTNSPPSTRPTPHQHKAAASSTNVEVVPSIETPPITTQSNNPISEFNAEYFLQQALAQVRHQQQQDFLFPPNANQQQKNQHQQQSNQQQNNKRSQQSTRRAFVSDSDEDEVIYQNPVHGVYRDPYVTIHYPVESAYFRPSEDAMAHSSEMQPTPSYYDFHLNNIPTSEPPQPTEAKKFHYMISAVKPKVVHEKDRATRVRLPQRKEKSLEILSSASTKDPFVIYPEERTPNLDELLATSYVTPRTLRGLRLGPNQESEANTNQVPVKRDIKNANEGQANVEVMKSQGGLLQEEIVHYHSPVKADGQFL
ncbi:uncharacterized protein LOC132197828 [Neocloeon triangulifer]|uniref:uncharacterized protein LOC132197828 n=1 Tax=Neocloeon triangulifer TaxID=2078957 RepID=UPI00286ED471|nr:uncharacterized protein LOC132197828 [Neocloeon triangulifer]